MRQAGVPEDFLVHLPSLFTSTRETCFVCFTKTDEAIARRLCADLRANGIACWSWWVPSDPFPTEEKYGERLEQAIFRSDALILILSEQALDTDWMRHIRSIVLGREDRERHRVLFPLRVDQAIVDAPNLKRYDWENLRKTHPIADFTHWQDPAAYQQALEQLLADLRAFRHGPGNIGIDR